MKPVRCLVAALIAATFVTRLAVAGGPMPVEAVIDLPSVAAYGPVAVVSPDGALAAFTVTTRQVRQVRVLSLKDSTSRTLSGPEEDAWGPAWSPDGRALAFFMQRDGQYGLWTWSPASGDAMRVPSAPLAGNPPWLRPLWTRDGRNIVVALAAPPAAAGSMDIPIKPPETDIRVFRAHRPGAATRLPSEKPMPSGGIGLVNVSTGAVRQLFTGQVGSFHLDPRGRRLAVAERLPRRDPNVFEVLHRLLVLDLNDGTTNILAENVTTAYGRIVWSPNGQYLGWVQDYAPDIGPAYIASVSEGKARRVNSPAGISFAPKAYSGRPPLWDARSGKFFLVADGQLWSAEPRELKAQRLTDTREWRIAAVTPGVLPGSAASADGYKSILVAVSNETTLQEGFGRVDLRTGKLSLLLTGDAHYADGINEPVVTPGGRNLVYVSQSAAQPEAFWLGDLAFNRPARRITPVNRGLEGPDYGRSQLVEWKNSRGDTLRGALLLPPHPRPGDKYPLVVEVYAEEGMEKSVNTFGLAPDGSGHLFATRGYALFRPGTKLRAGAPAADLTDDVLAGVDAAIRTDWIDGAHMGVMGHSYGGYNTLVLISRTGRFRAAVSAAGFADLISGVYGNEGKGTMSPGWAEGGQGRMGGSPWEWRDRYLENSPLWQMDKVHTPLLLIHGLDDDTVPPFASTMVFNALQRLGREVEYVQYAGEGHAILGRDHRIDYFRRVLAWFDEHLTVAQDGLGS